MEVVANVRFSGADLTKQQHKAAPVMNTLAQRNQTLPVVSRKIEKQWVRGIPKWLAFQAEAIPVHVKPRLRQVPQVY